MIPEAAVQAAAELIVQGDMGDCECRRSPYGKHDVNPPRSTRRRAIRVARAALEAAAPHMLADCERELADAKRVIALLVLDAGGKVAIGRRAITEMSDETVIESTQDVINGGWVIRARRPTP